jgi:hypothetical protein
MLLIEQFETTRESPQAKDIDTTTVGPQSEMEEGNRHLSATSIEEQSTAIGKRMNKLLIRLYELSSQSALFQARARYSSCDNNTRPGGSKVNHPFVIHHP